MIYRTCCRCQCCHNWWMIPFVSVLHVLHFHIYRGQGLTRGRAVFKIDGLRTTNGNSAWPRPRIFHRPACTITNTPCNVCTYTTVHVHWMTGLISCLVDTKSKSITPTKAFLSSSRTSSSAISGVSTFFTLLGSNWYGPTNPSSKYSL